MKEQHLKLQFARLKVIEKEISKLREQLLEKRILNARAKLASNLLRR